MERSAQPGTRGDANLTEAIERLWVRFLPEIEQRVAVLAEAAAAVASRKLTATQCEAAQAAAHKLAGVLGTFGLTHGTVLARELEIHFSREDGPYPSTGERLTAVITQLRAMIEKRRSDG